MERNRNVDLYEQLIYFFFNKKEDVVKNLVLLIKRFGWLDLLEDLKINLYVLRINNVFINNYRHFISNEEGFYKKYVSPKFE